MLNEQTCIRTRQRGSIAGRWTAGILIAVLAAAGTISVALAASAKIARRTVTVPVRDLKVPVPVSGDLTYVTREGTAVVDGRLEAELAAAQKHSTELLRALINRHTPAASAFPSGKGRSAPARRLRVTGTADYERTVCFGGNPKTIVPRSPIRIDLLLHPIVQARSARSRSGRRCDRIRNDDPIVGGAVEGDTQHGDQRLNWGAVSAAPCPPTLR